MKNAENRRIENFTQLIAWKESHIVVLEVYKILKTFPQSEQFGLISQMQRAAVSVTSNIAEGFGRESSKEKARFYYISKGSLTEIQNQLIISRDIGYIKNTEFKELFTQTSKAQRILYGLIRATKKHC